MGWGSCGIESDTYAYVYRGSFQLSGTNKDGCSNNLSFCGNASVMCGGCPPVIESNGRFYFSASKETIESGSQSYFCNTNNCFSNFCYSSSITVTRVCRYRSYCTSRSEADSVRCVNDGGRWEFNQLNGMYECNTNHCDTTMHCITYPFNRCETVESGGITCVNGQCSGIPGVKIYSELKSECRNECGDVQTRSITSDTAYVPGGSCEDDVKCGSEIFCGEFDNGTYFLYKKCYIGRETVGNVNEQQVVAQIESAGQGTCLENGYQSTRYPNSGKYGEQQGGTSRPSNDGVDSISSDCAIYGYGCADYVDTTDYSNPDNQSPQKKCWCEPFDGSNTVSRIICPDGTSRVVYFSCKDWQKIYSSSSEVSPPLSSSSASGGGSSGQLQNSSDSNPFQGKYPEYPVDDRNYRKNVQGALSGASNILSEIKSKLIEIKNYLVSDNEEFTVDSIKSIPHRDYSELDSLSISHLISFDTLLSKIDTSRKLIDSSRYVAPGTCPIITANFSTCRKIPFFRDNSDVDLKLDFSNLAGFNLCSMIKALVVGFTSVISFLLSFRVISKSGM